jgi:hypothetical protein
VKKGVFILLFICITNWGNAQISVLNGSFEIHSYQTCEGDMNRSDWNNSIPYSTAIDTLYPPLYAYGLHEIDLFTDSCTVGLLNISYTHPAQDQNWYLGLHSSDTTSCNVYFDTFTLTLSDSLTKDNWYEVSYYHHKGSGYPNSYPSHNPARGVVGVSMHADKFGDSLFTSSYGVNAWTQEVFTFQATFSAKHISFKALKEPGRRYQLVDNFSIREVPAPPPSTVIEQNLKVKKLVSIVDVFGRETNPKPNTPLFFIYDDGTVEKRLTIE